MTPTMAETRPDFYHCPTCDLSQNYEPNAIQWQPGAIVIHDADEKKVHMFMVVCEVVDAHTVITRYVRRSMPNGTKLSRGDMRNRICGLHDPRRFGITLPPGAENQMPPAPEPTDATL